MLCSCNSEKKELRKTQKKVEIVSEDLRYYALSEIDSVYSIAVKLHAIDSCVAKYVIHLKQDVNEFTDSLIFTIPANTETAGEIIFPTCRVKNRPKPTYQSKITIIEEQ